MNVETLRPKLSPPVDAHHEDRTTATGFVPGRGAPDLIDVVQYADGDVCMSQDGDYIYVDQHQLGDLIATLRRMEKPA